MTEKSSDNRIFVREEIAEALHGILETADKYGAEVCAATKTVPTEIINFAHSEGLRFMGENRVQELLSKYDGLSFTKEQIHFIGRLQTNKVRMIVGKVSLIHSLDSIRLAEEISKRSKALGIITPCLCEINSGMEENKGGIMLENAEKFITEASKLDGIKICGLMSIGPHMECEKDYIPYFEKVAKGYKALSSSGLLGEKPSLSMGMSDNYRLALEYGATIIRPGTAIFGRR